MENRYVTYFEAECSLPGGLHFLAFSGCQDKNTYAIRLHMLIDSYGSKNVSLLYREWSDGTIEDGIIEKEDWNIG